MRDATAGALGLLGAAMAFGGAAAAGALLGMLMSARGRLQNPRRLPVYGLIAAALLLGGAAFTRPEARTLVAVFAVVPFLIGGLFALFDLRRRIE